MEFFYEKTFVIGLDGATLDIIQPWIENGELPNIAKIMQEGVCGELKSTIPCNSAPGKNLRR